MGEVIKKSFSPIVIFPPTLSLSCFQIHSPSTHDYCRPSPHPHPLVLHYPTSLFWGPGIGRPSPHIQLTCGILQYLVNSSSLQPPPSRSACVCCCPPPQYKRIIPHHLQLVYLCIALPTLSRFRGLEIVHKTNGTRRAIEC